MSNVIQQLDAGLKSTPDLVILNQMQNPIVVVIKVLDDRASGGKRKDQLIINGQTGLTAAQILQLQDDLPTARYPKGGPGTYRFEVTDQGTTVKDVWQVRLGSPGDEAAAQTISRPGGMMSAAPPIQRGPAMASPNLPAIPVSPDVENLGNGFVYHKVLKILTVPDGRVFQWEPGKAFPDLSMVSTAMVNPATPISSFGASMFSQQVSPEVAELRAQTAALQTELAKSREEARERAQQAEIAALRESQEKSIAALTAKFEAIVEKITATPKDNTELIELRRKLEDRDRQDALRAEINAKMESLTALVRESASTKGPDPMINVLMQMMNQQAQGAQETMRLMRESANSQLAASQSSSERFLDFMQKQADAAKDSNSSIINEKFVSVLSGVMDTMLRVKEAEARIAGGGNGPDWMAVIQTLADKGGTALNALAQAQSKKAQAETAKAQAVTVTARAQAVADARATAELRARAAEAQPPALPAQPLEGEAARDALAAEMFPKREPETSAAHETTVTPLRPVTSEEHPPRRKGGKQENLLLKASLPELRSAFGGIGDAIFFGPFMESVDELRAEIEKSPGEYSSDDVAQFVLDAREFIAQALQENGGKIPLVVDMLAHNRFDYLFERMLPKAGQAFWGEAATALRAKLAAEKAVTE
jgi:hypothetical protein